MRTTAEITEARALIEKLIILRAHNPYVLRGQLQVLDWVLHKRLDAFAVRLLAAKAEKRNPVFREIS